MKILAAVDLSAASQRVVETCADLAGPCSAETVLLHVLRPDPESAVEEKGPVSAETLATRYADRCASLEALAKPLREQGVQVRTLLAQGPAVELVLKEAERMPADLLVIGSHGHGALYDIVVGSASLGILRASRIPVVVVPARED